MKSDPISTGWVAHHAGQVCICGLGARTALGFDAASTAAAVRAGISALAAHAAFVDKAGEPVQVAADTALPPFLPIEQRLAALLAAALAQLNLSALPPGMRLKVYLALPDVRPGAPDGVEVIACRNVADALAALAVGTSLSWLRKGHAGGLMALQLAATDLCAGRADFCAVVAADSYLVADTIEWLDDEGRLQSGANRNGFPPGEAGSALLLASIDTARRAGLPQIADVLATRVSFEPAHIHGEGPCTALGLSDAVAEVADACSRRGIKLGTTYCDLNGERYRNEELLYTLLRTQESFDDAHDFLHPADCWGDVGAASGPLYIALADDAWRKGYARGAAPLLWCGADSGERAAVALQFGRMVSSAVGP